MFPVTITITINKHDQLNAVLAALAPQATVGETGPAATDSPPLSSLSVEPAAVATPLSAPLPAQGDGVAKKRAKPAAEPAPAPTPAPEPAQIEDAPGINFEDVKRAFLALFAGGEGRAKCEQVLQNHGIARLSEAGPDQWASLLSAIKGAN